MSLTHRLSDRLVSSGSDGLPQATIAPAQCDGLVTSQMLPSRAHTDFHNRALTVLEPRYID